MNKESNTKTEKCAKSDKTKVITSAQMIANQRTEEVVFAHDLSISGDKYIKITKIAPAGINNKNNLSISARELKSKNDSTSENEIKIPTTAQINPRQTIVDF